MLEGFFDLIFSSYKIGPCFLECCHLTARLRLVKHLRALITVSVGNIFKNFFFFDVDSSSIQTCEDKTLGSRAEVVRVPLVRTEIWVQIITVR